MILLKSCRYVLTQDDERTILEHVDILVRGKSIAAIGDAGGDDLAPHDALVIDCSDKVVLPGLINTHTHLGMGLLRGYNDDTELHDWLALINEKAEELTAEERYEGSLLGCQEALRTGTTTVIDVTRRPEATARALTETGLRAWLCTSFSDQNIDEAEFTFVPDQNARITSGVSPHSIYASSETTIQRLKRYAREQGLLTPIHLAETRREQYEIKQRSGMLPAQYLDSLGFLDEQTLLVHGVWLTKGELRLIGERNASVSHCPTSNMKLAGGGVMPLKEMSAAGINVTLGTDSVASNNNLDMFEEMKFAALLQKHHYWDPTVGDAQHILDMATLNGAKALGLAGKLGCILEGAVADIITVTASSRLQPFTKERVVSHLIYSATGSDVADVIVDGELLLKDGVLQKRQRSFST